MKKRKTALRLVLELNDIDARIKAEFKALCAKEGTTMKEKLWDYIQSIIKKDYAEKFIN